MDATHPHALFLAGSNFVTDALTGHFALKLGKRQQNVEHQPPYRGRRAELLISRQFVDKNDPPSLDVFIRCFRSKQTTFLPEQP
nr:hypothetical protein [Nitrosomonas sp. Nm58]